MPHLRICNLTTQYPNGTRANDNVNLTVQRGEVHALVGENGAGKTTLMNVLSGLTSPSSGEIWLNNRHVTMNSPAKAIQLGIGTVHQHFTLVRSFTAPQNITLNREPTHTFLPWTDRTRATDLTRELSEQYNLPVDMNTPVGQLSLAEQQRVEILKALHQGAKLLILDEPTTVLTPHETGQLFNVVRRLAEQGKSVIFISHKLPEVFAVADQITVMRAGKTVATSATTNLTPAEVRRQMFGQAQQEPGRSPHTHGAPVLRLRDLSYVSANGQQCTHNINLTVHASEIIAIVGIVGKGQAQLANLITGGLRPASGTIHINGADMTGKSIAQYRRAGVAHIPADRTHNGIAQGATVAENLCGSRYQQFARFGLLNRRQMKHHADSLIDTYKIAVQDSFAPAVILSGGNLQKLILARELSTNPSLLVAVYPTRGVDAQSVAFIHKQLLEQRASGTGVLLISADLLEALSLADRIMVMRSGRIVADLPNDGTTTEAILGEHITHA